MNENIFDIKIYDDKKDDEEINETIIRMQDMEQLKSHYSKHQSQTNGSTNVKGDSLNGRARIGPKSPEVNEKECDNKYHFVFGEPKIELIDIKENDEQTLEQIMNCDGENFKKVPG